MNKVRLITIILLAVLILSCGSVLDNVFGGMTDSPQEKSGNASSSAAVPKTKGDFTIGKNQELTGTWINPDYDNEGRSGMVVFELQNDGSYKYTAYDTSKGKGDVYKGTQVYLERWNDAEGNLFGKSSVTLDMGMQWKVIDKISADGNTIETVPGSDVIDSGHPQYSIYKRK